MKLKQYLNTTLKQIIRMKFCFICVTVNATTFKPFVPINLLYKETINFNANGEQSTINADTTLFKILENGNICVSLSYWSSIYDQDSLLIENQFYVNSTTWKYEEKHSQYYNYDENYLRDYSCLRSNIGMGLSASSYETDLIEYYNEDFQIDSIFLSKKSAKYPKIVIDTIHIMYERYHNFYDILDSIIIKLQGLSVVESLQSIETTILDTIKKQEVYFYNTPDSGSYTTIAEKIIKPQLDNPNTYIYKTKIDKNTYSNQKIDLQADIIVEFISVLSEENNFRKITYSSGTLDTIIKKITFYNNDSTINIIDYYKITETENVLDKREKYYYKINSTDLGVSQKKFKNEISIKQIQKGLYILIPYDKSTTSPTISLVDIKGRVVLKKSLRSNKNKISINDLASGIYIGTIKKGIQVKAFKIHIGN